MNRCTSMIKGEPIYINGDGKTSRDFCFIANVVQTNLLAATVAEPVNASFPTVIASAARQSISAVNQICNIALGDRTTLNSLFTQLKAHLVPRYSHLQDAKPLYRDFRPGDVRHSLADIGKAQNLLGYAPTHRIGHGLKIAMPWYVQQQL
jgi:UDP-N-acetylglucosamine 4-epimerase